MSTKPKKKSEKVKTKKVKRAPLKEDYTDEELVELKNKKQPRQMSRDRQVALLLRGQ